MYGDAGCTCICMWQSVLAIVHLHAILPLAGFCTNTLSPFVSPYVNVEVSGGDGALVKKACLQWWVCQRVREEM